MDIRSIIELWDAIAQLAARQHGHVTRTQLIALGVPESTICSWIDRGRLIPVQSGVYAVGYRRVEPVALAFAAVLACGPGAVVSHDSTLALYGLWRWPSQHHVIAPRCVRRPGIRAHRSTTLTPAQCSLWLGVPTTRPARAIADMGRRLTDRQRIRLTNTARLQRVLTVDEQFVLLGHDRHPTRSALEDAFQRWIERYRIPQPLIGVIVNGHEVDAVWLTERVIVELDHVATHSDPFTFRSDRRHDRDDADLGYRTLRYTAEDLTAAEADRLIALLQARRP